MDLVSIGYEINARGLDRANKEVDELHGKLERLGRAKPINLGASTKQQSASIDATTKALEKQALIGQYLGQGFDRVTASSIASFRLLGSTVEQTNAQLSQLTNNKGLLQTQRDLQALAKQQEKAQLNSLNTQREYQRLSAQSFGGGVLDSVDKQNKALTDMRRHYADIEQAQKRQETSVRRVVGDYERLSNRSLGGGILDNIESQSKGLRDLNRHYADIEASQKRQEASARRSLELQQKQIAVANKTTQYRQEGFTSTNAGRLASFEINGATLQQLSAYRRALLDAQGGLQDFSRTSETATRRVGALNGEIAGIAKYAVLSAVIYGLMTATVSLATATVRLADEYTAIQNRMKLYISDAEELITVNDSLGRMAIENNVGLRETATLYTRLAPAMQKYGATAKEITAVVDAFGKSMRIGGATAMEASSATIQFSQAMAAGKLAGDEFRSISEASPRFLKAIADGAGIAAENLKKMSSAGALSTELIVGALIKEYPKLIEENKKLGVTLEQGVNALTVGFSSAIGQFNEGAKITETVGTAFTNVALTMFEFAGSAKESGVAFKDTFDSILGILKMASIGVGILATAWVSKYVASIILSGVQTVKTAGQIVALSAVTNRQTLTTAALKVSVEATAMAYAKLRVAMSSVVTAMGGWVGVGLTLASVATAFIMTRDSLEETNQKLVDQNKYVDMTTKAWDRLNEEQKNNAIFSLNKDIEEANNNVKELHKRFITMLSTSASVYMGDQGYQILDPKAIKIVEDARLGVISYTTAVRELDKLNLVDQKELKKLKEMENSYNSVASSAMKLNKPLQDVGQGVKLAGSEAQNAVPAIVGFANETEKLGFKSGETARKIQGLKTAFTDLASDTRIGTNLAKQFGLDSSLADDVVKKAREALAQEQEAYTTGLAKLENARELVAKHSEGAQKEALKATLEVAKKDLAIVEDSVKKRADILRQSLAKEAQDVQKARDERSAYEKSLKDEAKVEKKEDNSIQKAIEGYQEQIDSVERLHQLLKDGADFEIAKIASEKEYQAVFNNTAKAIDIALAKKKAQQLDYLGSLDIEAKQLNYIAQLQSRAVSYAEAREVVNAGFVSDAQALLAVEDKLVNTLQEQQLALTYSLREQQTLNEFLKQGHSLEVASLMVTEARLKKIRGNKGELEESQKLLLETLKAQTEIASTEKARGDYIQANTELSRQASLLAEGQDNELADVLMRYKGISVEEARSLMVQEKIVATLSEYNNLLKDQKTLIHDLSKINFEAFGDFGDPFQKALGSLNNIVFGVQNVKKEYQEMYSEIQKEIDANTGNEKAQNDAREKMAKLRKQEIADEADAKAKAINSGWSLAKSTFEEESKGYKVIGALEKAYQASQVAFAVWKKRNDVLTFATTIKNKLQEISLEKVLNALKTAGGMLGAGALLLVGGAILANGIGDSITGSFDSWNNEGKGTVFGDSDATSKSISNAIDRLSDNSDLMLPVNQAMLKSLRNIENSFKGVANLLIRGEVGEGIAEGYDAKFNGFLSGFTKAFSKVTTTTVDVLTLGLDKALLGGAISGLINDVFGSVLGGLFGKTSKKIVAQGLVGFEQSLGSVLSNGFNLMEYADIETKKKSWFSSKTKRSTQYGEASQEIESQFSLIFGNIFDSVMSATSVLDMDGEEIRKKLESFVVNLGKIDTKGLSGGEIQEKLESVIGAEADKIAKYATSALVSFQQVGEGYFETLTRVASGIEVAKYYTDRLNVASIDYQDIINKQGDVTTELIRQSVLLNESTKNINGGFYDLVNTFDGSTDELVEFVYTLRDLQDQLFVAGKNVEYLTSSMILGAGGIESLASGFNAYFDLLSPAEQASELTRRLANEMSLLGQELPKDVKGFRDLLASIDVTAESGQKLYGGLIALTPEFVDLQSALEASASEAERMAQEALKAQEEARKAQEEARKAQEEFEAMMKKLRQAIIITGQTADKVNQSMINGAGSSDILLKGFESIFGMLSPAEKATELTRRMTEQFKALGVEMPKSIDDYRALLKGMDLSSDASKYLFGQIVALAPEFAELHSAMESANTGVDALVQSLRDLAEEAMKARGEANQTSTLEATRHAFSVNSALAMQGDKDAAERLLSLGANLLELSKTYSITSDDYSRDLALVQSSATVSADVQELGLGYENEPLIPVSSIGQTNTLETKSGETDEKIETMRLDLNSALIAIAKYTQITATKLENWDYEGRMLVRVEQDPVDDAIPVKAL